MTIKDKQVKVHQHFRLFIVSTDSNIKFSPEVYSCLTVVNFALSESRLTELAHSQLASVEWRAAHLKQKSCHADNVEDGFRLKSVEDKTLHLLATATGNLLDNE